MDHFDCAVTLVSVYPLKTRGGLFEVAGMEMVVGDDDDSLAAVRLLPAHPVSMTALTMIRTALTLSFMLEKHLLVTYRRCRRDFVSSLCINLRSGTKFIPLLHSRRFMPL